MVQGQNAGVSRRQLGFGLGLAASALGLADKAAAAPAADYDVVVIGGGFAGVTAAREAGRDGHRVLLIEARDRLGGRTHTAMHNGHMVEYGAAWVHWCQPNTWAEIQRYGIELIDTASAGANHIVLVVDGQRRELSLEEAYPALVRAFEVVLGEAEVVFPRPYEPFFAADEVAKRADMSVADRLAQVSLTETERQLFTGLYLTLAGCPLDQVAYLEALREYALPGGGVVRLIAATSQLRFKNGTAALVEAIRADGEPDILLSDPVSHVAQDTDWVRVTTRSGKTVRARSAIVAIPLNLLSDVAFDPPLNAAKRTHAQERHAGIGVKAYVMLRQDVGPIQALGLGSEPINSVLTLESGPEGSTLVIFGADHRAIDVTDRTAVERALRKFIPGADVLDVAAHDWNTDPYSRGAWCHFRPGQFSRLFPADREPEGRLFFASADTATGWRGYIDGAIERGVRTGLEVNRLLRAAKPLPA